MTAILVFGWFFSGAVVFVYIFRALGNFSDLCMLRTKKVASRFIQTTTILIIAYFAAHITLVEIRSRNEFSEEKFARQLELAKNMRVLDSYLSREPLSPDDIWWKNLQQSGPPAFAASALWPYNVVLVKHLGGTPAKDQTEFVNYYMKVVRPAIFSQQVVIYKPDAENDAPAN